MDKIQSSIEKIGPPASILQDAFGALGDAAGSFASWVGDVLTYTLGGLLKDAIEAVTSAIVDMISATIDAGNEFQTLRLRLTNINLDALMKSGKDYNTATKESIDLTEQQLSWLQKLAMATPYDNTDISQVYSLARSYGFADEKSRQLTEGVSDFASSMGLTGDRLEGIIKQFGAMTQRGKITGTAMRSLAQGSFMPLDDILARIAKTMGITTKELSKLISTPEGIPADLFITAFEQMVAEEPRFSGASEKMARTFVASTNNVKDLVTSIGGLNIVTPILDVLGGKIADFMDQFIKSDASGQKFTDLGQRLIDSAVKIGKALSDIVSSVLGLMPSSNDLANGLVNGLEFVSTWLTDNKDAIVGKIQEIVDWFVELGNPKSDFQTNVIQPFRDLYDVLFTLKPGDQITGWQMLMFAIQSVASAIGGVLSLTLKELGITDLPKVSFSVADLVLALLSFSNWIKENQGWLSWLLTTIIAFIVIQTITNIVWGFIAGLVGLAVTVLTVVAVVGALFTWLVEIIAIVTAVIVIFKLAQVQFSNFAVGIQFGIDLVVGYFNNMENTIRSILTRIDTAWRQGNWWGIGWAIVSGIADGIGRNAWLIISAAETAALSAYTAAKRILGIRSPSTMFAGIGENLMLGMAQGIADSAGIAVSAMQGAISAVSVPAMAAPSVMAKYTSAPSAISNTYQSNNQYNLAIHSNAQTEQVAADFSMMTSLAGV